MDTCERIDEDDRHRSLDVLHVACTLLMECINVLKFLTLSLQVAQHRDVVQSEYARVSLAKSKLESLCRELQKHNRAVVVRGEG